MTGDLFGMPAHDPGGKTKRRLPAGMIGDAVFSPCGRYRHVLTRRWSPGNVYALWIGMNPSVAGPEINDPTLDWECAYTRDRLHVGGLVKVNVMNYRATNPKDLLGEEVDPCSIHNSGHILEQARHASIVIAAWGVIHPNLRHHAEYVRQILKHEGIDLWCVGLTKGGHPRHPLYVKRDVELVRYPREALHG